MNLRQNPKAGETPWYHQPVSAQETAAQAPLYDTAAAERILVRAGVLQEGSQQMLTVEQVEAIAAEAGIQPEFVRLAMEQEDAGIATEQVSVANLSLIASPSSIRERLAVILPAVQILSYNLIVGGLWSLISLGSPYRSLAALLAFYVFPAFMAITLGAKTGNRRWGAFWGAILMLTLIGVALLLYGLQTGSWRLEAAYIKQFTVMIAVSALLGAAGAQGRRMVAKRQRTDRSARSAHNA